MAKKQTVSPKNLSSDKKILNLKHQFKKANPLMINPSNAHHYLAINTILWKRLEKEGMHVSINANINNQGNSMQQKKLEFHNRTLVS